MDNLGFLAALGAAVAWGSYLVPFKKSKSDNLIQFQALMGVGIGLSGLILSILLGFSINFNVYGLTSGILWATANAIFLVAAANLGLAKAVPIASSLVIIFSFLWGALVFHEMPAGIIVGFLGIGLIILGVVLIGTIGNMASQNIKRGLLAAVSAGVIWGSQLVPLKVGQVATRDFFFPVCLGILLSGLIIFALNRKRFKKEAIGLSLFSGLVWNIGNLLSLISLSVIGLSKMGPISQSATLVAVLWGLFYFKEIIKLKARLQVLVGAIILLVGVATLAFA
ncbi:MAG: GRP family sugar transporter [Candidatus Daviesbacteria bacterium]|nr:GRP family sugar transporter [Candidatus Daviesbacteria bacterium]